MMAYAFLRNLMRSRCLTSQATNYGHAAIEGAVHNAADYAVRKLTVVVWLGLLPFF